MTKMTNVLRNIKESQKDREQMRLDWETIIKMFTENYHKRRIQGRTRSRRVERGQRGPREDQKQKGVYRTKYSFSDITLGAIVEPSPYSSNFLLGQARNRRHCPSGLWIRSLWWKDKLIKNKKFRGRLGSAHRQKTDCWSIWFSRMTSSCHTCQFMKFMWVLSVYFTSSFVWATNISCFG